jgi:pimeloyl-ACP methyl ester carboxylesterase
MNIDFTWFTNQYGGLPLRLVVNGIGLHVRAQGNGAPALVFLHYFGGSSRSWDDVIRKLAAGYRCIAPDLRGFGDSAAPLRNYALDDLVSDIARLIDALKLERYTLVGHDMGGKIALAFAAREARAPGQLASVVLVAPTPPVPETVSYTDWHLMLQSHSNPSAGIQMARLISTRPLTGPALARFVKDHARTSRSAWQGWLTQGSREDIREIIDRVSVPVRIIIGEDDPIAHVDTLERELMRRLNCAEIVGIRGAGHLLPLEAPSAVSNAILDFVSQKA